MSKGEYHSPQEQVFTPATALESAIIPSFRSQLPQRYSFRFGLNSGSVLSTAWTTTMLLDMYCVAVGGSATPARIFNNIKLTGLKIWQPGQLADQLADVPIILEFSPSLTAGFGGAPRVPYTANSVSTAKMAHLAVRPRPRELASQWFSAQQTVYTLFNLQAAADSILQVDLVATMVNAEIPVSCAYTSAVAKGTIGVTNFGLSGCRSIGLENLVNP